MVILAAIPIIEFEWENVMESLLTISRGKYPTLLEGGKLWKRYLLQYLINDSIFMVNKILIRHLSVELHMAGFILQQDFFPTTMKEFRSIFHFLSFLQSGIGPTNLHTLRKFPSRKKGTFQKGMFKDL